MRNWEKRLVALENEPLKPVKTDITRSCAFLKITLSRLGDKKGLSSDQIEVDADKDRIKSRKVIFKSPKFDAIRTLDASIRKYIRGQEAAPFASGIHLVPMKMLPLIYEELSGYQLTREHLVEGFAEVYPDLIQDSRVALKSNFNDGDYETDVREEFHMEWQILAFSVPAVLEGISSDIFKAEKEKWAHKLEEAYEEARYLLRETMLKMVSHLRERLEPESYGLPKRLSPSTVRNFQEFLENFELKNVTNDVELQRYVNTAKDLLSGVSTDALRENEGIRARIRTELNTIEQFIDQSISVAPVRRIRHANVGG